VDDRRLSIRACLASRLCCLVGVLARGTYAAAAGADAALELAGNARQALTGTFVFRRDGALRQELARGAGGAVVIVHVVLVEARGADFAAALFIFVLVLPAWAEGAGVLRCLRSAVRGANRRTVVVRRVAARGSGYTQGLLAGVIAMVVVIGSGQADQARQHNGGAPDHFNCR
jgi:hypothetical protein